jgi:hypothetical protein
MGFVVTHIMLVLIDTVDALTGSDWDLQARVPSSDPLVGCRPPNWVLVWEAQLHDAIWRCTKGA